MLKLLKVTLVAFCLFNANASVQKRNPHFKNTIAKENYLKATAIGTEYALNYENTLGNQMILFYGDRSEVAKSYRFIKDQARHRELQVNINLNGGPIEFLSWVLFQGMVAWKMDQVIGPKADLFIESEIFIKKESMKYLDQVFFSVNNQTDYSQHPRFDYARNRKLYMEDFYQAWSNNSIEFKKLVIKRAYKMNPELMTIEEGLASRTYSVRLAAKKLKRFLRN
tara:strand:+ start:224727 stop:225398 length:672 start_codon:yes stop_codon:yes gene_type:complete